MLDIPRSEQVLRETAFPWDFPRGPVVKTLCFHCRGCGFDPCSGNQDPTCHVAENKNHCSLPALSFYVHLVPQAAELGGILVAVCLVPPSIESSSKFCWFFSQGISFFPFFFFSTAQCGLQALSSLTGNRAWAHGSGSTDYWTAMEFRTKYFLNLPSFSPNSSLMNTLSSFFSICPPSLTYQQ